LVLKHVAAINKEQHKYRQSSVRLFVCSLYTHLAVCLTRGPKLLPQPEPQIVRSRAFSFRCEYPLLSLRLPSRFLRLLPRLPVTSIPPFIFPSITCSRMQFYTQNVTNPVNIPFIHLIICLTTGPKPLPKRALHIVRSRASSFR
jgi:hypothetical protein